MTRGCFHFQKRIALKNDVTPQGASLPVLILKTCALPSQAFIFTFCLLFAQGFSPTCVPMMSLRGVAQSAARPRLPLRVTSLRLRITPRGVKGMREFMGLLQMQEENVQDDWVQKLADRAAARAEEDSEVGRKMRELVARIQGAGEVQAPNKLFKALKKPSGAPSVSLCTHMTVAVCRLRGGKEGEGAASQNRCCGGPGS